MTVILRLPAQLAAVVAERAKALAISQDQYVLQVVMRSFEEGTLP